MKKLLYLLFLLVSSCATTLTGYHFETIAVYQASISKLRIDLTATGYVRAGEDVGEGQVIGAITSSEFTDTLCFHITHSQLIELKYGSENIEIAKPEDISGVFMSSFDKIGYKEYNQQEMKELENVIIATTYGPKGTYLENQTDFINVISVEFKRK